MLKRMLSVTALALATALCACEPGAAPYTSGASPVPQESQPTAVTSKKKPDEIKVTPMETVGVPGGGVVVGFKAEAHGFWSNNTMMALLYCAEPKKGHCTPLAGNTYTTDGWMALPKSAMQGLFGALGAAALLPTPGGSVLINAPGTFVAATAVNGGASPK